MKSFQSKTSNNENGITLIISIVLLAAVTFISFSISSIVIREIMGGRLTLKSEPAISAANSGGEVGLYRLFREVGGTSVSGNVGQSGVSYQVTADLYDDPYNFTVSAGQELNVLLYDAENTNNQSANYGSATITLNSNSGIADYQIFSWGNSDNAICIGTLAGGQTSAPCFLNEADDRYIIKIQASGTIFASGFVQAKDNFNQPKGIPSDSPKLDVKGTNGPVQRRIEINL